MDDQAASIPPISDLPALSRETEAAAPLWHLGWLVGVVAAGASLLAGLGAVAWPTLVALAFAAAPGAAGYLWRPAGREHLVLIALWGLAAVVAASVQGGLTGPLGVWCVMPLLAGALTGATAAGAVTAAVTFLVVVLIELAGRALPAPKELFGLGVSAAGVLTTGGAAVGLLAILAARARERMRPSLGEADAAAAAMEQVAALEEKLKAAEQARDQASDALTEATAAREAAEAAQADAEANAMAKSRFLANMSHELRTPLNAIMGFSDIMRTKMFGPLPGRYADYPELIHESGRHLTDLINDVLDMSKIEAERYTLSREVFDAREAVSAALRLVRLQADDAGVQLRGLPPAAPLLIDADRRALKQIVLNLVSNALKFTPRGGSVTVSTQAVGGAFELVVADTGVGIARDDLERLGRPFEQAGDAEHKAQGTGLGLSLVQAFARLHGGDMNIESELGEGVAVTVRLPVLAQPAPAEAAPGLSIPVSFAADEPDDLPAQQTNPPPPPPERPRMGEVIPLHLPR